MAVHRTTVLPVAPSRLWEALTDDALLSRWYGADVTLDPRPGGRGIFRGPDGTRTARVREAERELRLAFEWDDEPDAGVDLTITAVPGGSRLDVVETPPASLGAPEASIASAGSARHDGTGWDPMDVGSLRWTEWDMRLVILCDVLEATGTACVSHSAPRVLVAV
jgi:uncharacterized protein YndB with AHSA1/START domain